ncbi:MAG: GDSL family lipase [Planctomycetota bacterium]|nr:MAG: GDSL family lipase [Planctomycetota bacterium]
MAFLGDSITEGWEWNGRDAWDSKLVPLGAINLGVSGDETAHVLWRLRQGHLDALHPQLLVLMIGTNNSGNAGHTPQMIGDGVAAIVAELQRRMPETKVLLLGIFPRGETPEDRLRRNNAAANQILERLADNARVFYLDIGSAFLEPDGTISRDVMPDFLHLTRRGYELWMQALEPKLRELLR